MGKIYTAGSDPLDAMLARHLMSSSLGGAGGAGGGEGGGQACEGARGRGQAHGLAGGGGEEGEGEGGWVEEGLVELAQETVCSGRARLARNVSKSLQRRWMIWCS